jgi:hypothetical protein
VRYYTEQEDSTEQKEIILAFLLRVASFSLTAAPELCNRRQPSLAAFAKEQKSVNGSPHVVTHFVALRWDVAVRPDWHCQL